VTAFEHRCEKYKESSAEYAHALFDLGYLDACLKYMYSVSFGDGYATIIKALSLLGGNAEMEFACAMICKHPKRDALKTHLLRARKGAGEDPLLAKNIEKQFGEEYSRLD
jgi:hypothetical protein